MRTALLLGIMTYCLTASLQPASAETQPPQFIVGLGMDVASGTFGTDSTSTYVTTPLIVTWLASDRLDFELTVPLLYQRTENTGYAALGTTATVVARQQMNGQFTYTGGSTTVQAASTAGGGTTGNSEFGLGDVTLVSGFSIMQESDATPRIRATFYLKAPTADADRGLGTGKFDFGPGATVSKWLGDFLPFAEGRYVFQGAGSETGAKDFFTADVGIGYSWLEKMHTSLYAKCGSAAFSELEAPLEARLKNIWRFGDQTYTEAYLLKGLSDGSPDYGGGVAIFFEY